MRLAVGLLGACFFASAALAVVPSDQDKVFGQIEAAIAGGRLIQADRMIERLQVGHESQDRLSSLKADLALAKGDYAEAYTLYASLAAQQGGGVRLLTGAGLAALRLHRTDDARSWLIRATALKGADWRAWNGLGISSDFHTDWATSETAYRKASALAPREASVWNNFGYSYLCQHRFAEAGEMLRRAALLAPADPKIRINLQIADAVSGHYPQDKASSETPVQWATRLNNAGYSALLVGDRAAARSLLARAIEVSDVRFPKAEANLRLVEAPR